MIINDKYPGLTKDESGYIYAGDIYSEETIEINLDDHLTVNGSIKSLKSIIATCGIKALYGISAEKSIKVDGDLKTPGCLNGIFAGEGIKACGCISADYTFIKAGWGIKAYKGITAYEDIKAGDCIEAGEDIKTDNNIKAEYIISHKSITAGHGISAGQSIKADEDIKAEHNITAGEDIKAGGCITTRFGIEAGYGITAGRSITATCEGIEAGEYITSGESITAGAGITAGCAVSAKTYIDCGGRIFAGIKALDTDENCQKDITCAELKRGDICYGNLVLKDSEKIINNNWSRVIDNLVEIRRSKGITQSALAESCGIKRSVLTDFENKKHAPQLDTLVKIAAALGCKITINHLDKYNTK